MEIRLGALRRGHESLTLAFCLATKRCMDFGPFENRTRKCVFQKPIVKIGEKGLRPCGYSFLPFVTGSTKF